ncbi:O-antigen ligase family protein [Pelagibacterales bacterium SAG-MED31]|nr:O-antigen ligase family protein [Pelagibacterales bacterium SAG-MED31]
MLEYFKFDLKRISLIILYLLPISLLTGPAIPDISITLISILFLSYSFINKDIKWLKETWVIAGLAFWISLLLLSFFSINKYESFQNAFIFIRYIVFAIAISNWLINDKKSLEFFLKILTISIIFILLDCLLQFVNYNSIEGYGEDIFGFTSTHYGRLSGPFNDDVPGSHISRFIFFIILLFIISKKNIFFNNYSFIITISSILFIIWLSGEAMALATTVLGFVIYVIFIKRKKNLVIIAALVAFLMILVTNKFHISNYDYKIISSTPYHHGLIMNKFGKCSNVENKMCSKLVKTNPAFSKVIRNFDKSIYFQIYRDAINMWSDNKFTGVGLSNFEQACKENKKYRSKKINYGACSAHPHNIYIQFLAETGLIGLLFFSLFIFSILFNILKNFNSEFNKLSFINLCILFWPIMSTGSLLKNWYGIEVFLVIGLLISITKINLFNSNSKF